MEKNQGENTPETDPISKLRGGEQNKDKPLKQKRINTATMFSTGEVAAAFNVHRSTVYRWTRVYGLPYYKLGGLVRFREIDLINFIRDNWEIYGPKSRKQPPKRKTMQQREKSNEGSSNTEGKVEESW